MFILVMGVSSSGKTTTARLLAERVGLAFHDADDFHSPENRAKMASDQPLDDDDRGPWLEQLSALAAVWEADGGAVLACSALKRAHRDILVQHVTNYRVVYLELSREEAVRRLTARLGHHPFIGQFARLLEGQYRDLEPPEQAVTLAAELEPSELVLRAARALGFA